MYEAVKDFHLNMEVFPLSNYIEDTLLSFHLDKIDLNCVYSFNIISIFFMEDSHGWSQ